MGNASPINATEGVLLLAAAVDTILVAGLAILASGVGTGSVTVALFLRLNDLLLGPFAAVPAPAGARAAIIVPQAAAIVGYGLLFLLLIAGVSWLDRRRLLY
jgi:hypothetical protein